MKKSFSSAAAALHDMLDRLDDKPDLQRVFATIDYDPLGSVAETDRLDHELKTLHDRGIIELRPGEPVRVKLTDPDGAREYLGRTSSRDRASQALSSLGAEKRFPGLMARIEASWSRGKGCQIGGALLAAHDTASLKEALTLAHAVLDLEGSQDHRTLSRRAGLDSKALERREGLVAGLLATLRDDFTAIPPREVLAAHGVEKIPQPFVFSGPLPPGLERIETLDYLGVPPEGAPGLMTETPTYVLSIENWVSFHRHATEINRDKEGLILFTSGFPSRRWAEAYGEILEALPPEIPVLHWGDIDPGGLRIAEHLARIPSERPRGLRLHLMDPTLAEQHGQPVSGISAPGAAPSNKEIEALWSFLSGKEARTLEQEELEPRTPGRFRGLFSNGG